MDPQKKRQPEKNEQPPYTFSDERTKKKIKKHITDIKDIITESDIANAKVPGAEKEKAVPPAKNDESSKEKQTEEFSTGKPITPWDIIDE